MRSNFSENLIKGRIVETIFQEMFLASDKYNVYPFGYEQTLPQIAQTDHDEFVKKVIDDIRGMPDFVVTPREKDGVYLVEVKYQWELNIEKILIYADRLYNRWNCPWIFLATQDKLYFESCNEILNKRSIAELSSEKWISTDLQEEYLTLLRKYIKV